MCGVFGIFNHPEAANLAYLGLHALQHRGQESAGVVSNERGMLHAVRQMGHVADVFTQGPNAIAPTGSMSGARLFPQAVNLPDGTVMIVGGGPLESEIYQR